MTEQEFRDSCAKFDIKIVYGGFQDMDNYLLCQWKGINLGHYNKNSCLAVITNNFVKNTYYIFGKMHNLVNADLEHTTNFLHNDKLEERFAYLIKAYKQDIINNMLKSLENDFE